MEAALVFAAFLAAPEFTAFDEPAARPLTYAEAREKALKENRPLVCWIGTDDVVCPACVATLKNEAVHYIAPTFPGVVKSAIVVAVPEGGELLRVADITAWIVGSPEWGHTPSVRRAIANWRSHRRVIRSGWSTDIIVVPPSAAPLLSNFHFAPRAPLRRGGG